MACNKFVSHVTGFSTLFGVEMVQGDISTAAQVFLVPVFFLIGSLLSGFLIDGRMQRSLEPRYSLVFFFMTLSTATILGLGASHVFGAFGMTADMENDFLLLALLCFSCGLQNATVTSAYGAVVRTTHLTGLTTDLGVGLSKMLNRKIDVTKRRNEVKANLMRVGIIVSFTMGSLICGFIFVKANYWGFVIPFLISLGLLIFSLAFKEKTM